MNSITDLLDLEDSHLQISNISIDGTKKYVTIETSPEAHFCPSCGFRMHSRGIKKRQISHPVLQDGYELILILKQRRWRCTNSDCRYETNEAFKFVNRNRRSTNATDMLIVLAFKDLLEPASSIANRFHTSDTHVLEIFDRYVKLDRLPLPDIISVDEVYTDMDEYCKYALVIQDFYTGDPIDILRSRRTNVTEPYFASIPIEERNSVKYLLSDMYNPYISFVDKYFPNAVPVVDSFHVVQWIIHSIDMYMRTLVKKYRQRDRDNEKAKVSTAYHTASLPVSDEVYMLQHYRWLILANHASIKYHSDFRMDHHFHRLMNTYDYEAELFRIDPKLRTLRDLKEMYLTFNSRNAGHPLQASSELDELISHYNHCQEPMFNDFAQLLSKYRDPIINSFVMTEKHGPGGIYDSRLSNGPIESLNRKIKDLKRMGRGFTNFEHFRNRFLYATRNNPILNGSADQTRLPYLEDEEF